MTDQADVVVIGGGVIGVSIAWALGQLGKRVVVLERAGLAGGASGTSFAWLNSTAKTVEPHYHKLNEAGLAAHHALIEEIPELADCLYGIGDIHWGEPGRGDSLARIRAWTDRLAEFGHGARRLDLAGLQDLEPGIRFADGAEGFLAPADRWLDAPRYVEVMHRRIVEDGGAVRLDTPVTGFGYGADGGITAVETYQGAIETARVVVAAGTATPALAALAANGRPAYVPVDAVRGLLVDVPADVAGGLIRHIVHTAEDGVIHFRPNPDGGLLIGTSHTADGLGDLDRAVDAGVLAKAAAAMVERAGRFLPALDVAAARRRAKPRLNYRPMPGDGYSIVGPLNAAPEVYVTVTHSGVTLGPLLGRLVAAEIVSGEPSNWLAPYRPDRFSQA